MWHSDLDPTRPTRRAHADALLRSILGTADQGEILASHPCKVRGGGTSVRSRRVEPASLNEIEHLVNHLPAKYPAMVLIGASCGRRFGEMAELRRIDLVSPPGSSM